MLILLANNFKSHWLELCSKCTDLRFHRTKSYEKMDSKIYPLRKQL